MSITEKLGKMGVPGFRSGKKWKMIVAVIGYFWIFSTLLTIISIDSSDMNKERPKISVQFTKLEYDYPYTILYFRATNVGNVAATYTQITIKAYDKYDKMLWWDIAMIDEDLTPGQIKNLKIPVDKTLTGIDYFRYEIDARQIRRNHNDTDNINSHIYDFICGAPIRSIIFNIQIRCKTADKLQEKGIIYRLQFSGNGIYFITQKIIAKNERLPDENLEQFWNMIVSGFANYVNNDLKQLQDKFKFFDFEGREAYTMQFLKTPLSIHQRLDSSAVPITIDMINDMTNKEFEEYCKPENVIKDPAKYWDVWG